MSSKPKRAPAEKDLQRQIADMNRDLNEYRRRLSFASNYTATMLNALQCTELMVHEDLTVNRARNGFQVFNCHTEQKKITDLFEDEEAEAFFRSFKKRRNLLEQAARKNQKTPWECSFQGSIEEWQPYPYDATWQIDNRTARSVNQEEESAYLVSPHELIGHHDDFRVEYTARAEGDPCDLSLVVGGAFEKGHTISDSRFPDDNGYCFAFGAFHNRTTELQKVRRTVTYGLDLIEPGQDHHCVAERIGGRLRMYIDGELAYENMDAQPITGPNSGYVALYTCGRDHIFSNIKVFTRPTCIDDDVREMIAANRNKVLCVSRYPAMHVEADYLGNGQKGNLDIFLFKNVTSLVEAREELTQSHEMLETKVDERTAELMKAYQALRASEERYALAARSANEGLWDWDLESGKVYYAPRWEALTGYPIDSFNETIDGWIGRVHQDDVKKLKTAFDSCIEGDKDHIVLEIRIMHREGGFNWFLVCGTVVRDGMGYAGRMAGSISDISARKEAEERLLHDAVHDALTGLPNRSLFIDRLQHAIDYDRRNRDYGFAVLFLDVDRFKLINDSMGHLAGDQVLKMTAQRLREALRTNDAVARIGGDEFALLLDDVPNEEAAIIVTERIQRDLREPFLISGQEVQSNGSIGVALSALGHKDPHAYLRDADTAMYRAKQMGRGRHMVFSPGMESPAGKRLETAAELRTAIGEEQLVLHFQPIVDLGDGTITGFEALVRWNHPEEGLKYPGDFIGLAEDSGLIIALGRWVIREACRQIHFWQDELKGELQAKLAVNLSYRQFVYDDLLQDIEGALEEYAIDPNLLIFEVPESLLMENIQVVQGNLERLEKLKFGLAVDDFGTSYSSLKNLQGLPLDILKIDRSFIAGSGKGVDNAELALAMIDLAHHLHMQVIAEGVETHEQLQELRSFGCDQAQGYGIHKPVDSQGALELLME